MEKFDQIWEFIEEKLNAPVPIYFKYILKYCGFSNGISIASIEDDDIQHFISEVKNGNVTKYFKQIIGEVDILDGSMRRVENFEFSRGHLKFLMSIVKFLRKYIEDNGPEFTTNVASRKTETSKKGPKTRTQKLTKNYFSAVNTDNLRSNQGYMHLKNLMGMQKRILISKMLFSLKSHTPKLYEENVNEINDKIHTELIAVKAESTSKSVKNLSKTENLEASSEGSLAETVVKYKANMLCPYCWKSITIFYISGTQWNSTNFDRHVNIKHFEIQKIDAGETLDEEINHDLGRVIFIPENKTHEYEISYKDELIQSRVQSTNKHQSLEPLTTIVENENSTRRDESLKDIQRQGAYPKDSNRYVKRSTHSNKNWEKECVSYEDQYDKLRNMYRQSLVSYSESDNDSDTDYVEEIISELPVEDTNHQNMINVTDQNENKTVQESDSLLSPKTGDYVICSIPIENSDKWPENVENVVGRVTNTKDSVGENALEIFGNSQILSEIELQFLKKHRCSNFIFINPDTDDVSTIPRNGILKILQGPSQNRRGDLVFKDETDKELLRNFL